MFPVPPGACDCHTHVFGPAASFPFAAGRTYTPGEAPPDALLELQNALGLDRVVLVQPSPYGADNACMLDGLRRLGPARGRGVAVIDEGTTEAALRDMHDAGVRGVRINLHTAGRTDPAMARAMLLGAARRVASLGWHVQAYTELSVIAALRDTILDLPGGLVIDHFGRPEGRRGLSQPGLDALLDLLRAGAVHVKLSAAHRLSDWPDCEDMAPLARAMIEANPDRVLWGSDWPHAGPSGGGSDPSAVHPFRQVDDRRALARLAEWAGDEGRLRRLLVTNPARLYGWPL
ncbi:amidohydrolase family protein [Pararoseomonas indoligenes]|uniref:Amidohydrolase family protein n=1 Tax=Roseomonas indoligenes TaxID=2820811 RepID=A0A940N7I3_9PROT|nr:amidohydrolase family protein [Pararoseomonas indoligenes]MBP0495517.1 amidohydrolase family protein [Pararoseomonas indoligenes]